MTPDVKKNLICGTFNQQRSIIICTGTSMLFGVHQLFIIIYMHTELKQIQIKTTEIRQFGRP